MFLVAQKILFTYLLNLEVLVPTTNIATTIKPSMLPIGAPRSAVGVPVKSDESTELFHPTLPLNDEIVFTAREREKKKMGFVSWRIAEVGSSGIGKWWEIWRERTSGSQGSLACTVWKTRKKMEIEMEGQEGHFAFDDDDDDADVVFFVVVVVVVRTIVVKTEIGEEKRVVVVCDGEEDEWK